ncbi:DUF1127 domain-containing protein [Jhaorihella thermophila]|uniref:YjiS-like domain-containing protein n=1 Tax=Jhaorihella thermophila TaxID=488547 RepID=A0A1H5U7J7_9RHOB|nr:DUF1127 domain-containing protein [Jhaorihella thermophila]SEF71026.1 protein of unknown function [Jhaorihella thermophila]
MAAIDTTRSAHGSHGLVGRIGSVINHLVAAFTAWNDARVTRKALSALTDRELEDIGLTRADIDRIAGGN